MSAIKWALFLMAFPTPGIAYTVVQASSAATAGIESEFIAATTTQFNAKVVVNPFFAGTYQMTLLGENPNYNPTLTNVQLLNSLVAVSTNDYVYGFSNGLDYQNEVDEGITAWYGVNCSTPSAFTLIYTSTMTFNKETCEDVASNILDAFYQINLSTPPVLPPPEVLP